MTGPATSLSLEIWSDIACSWCYVGKRRIEAALAAFEHRDRVDVRWRSFELDPSAPRVADPEVSYAQRLAKKYSSTPAEAEGMIRTMTETAAGVGLDFHFERIRPGNTFDAHRLVHLARSEGKQDEAKERLFRAYLTEGEPIGDRDVLARLGVDLGFELERVRTVLAGEEFASDVRADEQLARHHGIRAVPFFAFAGRFGASGAQPAEVLGQMLDKAWGEREG